METNSENSYYHGGQGSGNRHDSDRRNELRDGDFGREYEMRYRNQDGRNRKAYDEYQSPNNNYSRSSYGSNWGNSGVTQARRNYSTGDAGSGYGYDSDRNGNDRTPGSKEQGGYGTGRMGGYSGSAFGGSNYSSKGSFSGNNAYGSMSGGGGNMSRGASSSGYGYESQRGGSDRGVPDYNMERLNQGSGIMGAYGSNNSGESSKTTNNRRTSWDTGPYGNSSEIPARFGGGNSTSGGSSYKGYGSNNDREDKGYYKRSSDRGGYINYDPNNRWNS